MPNHHKNQCRCCEEVKERCQGERIFIFKDGKCVGLSCLNCAKNMKEEDDSYNFITKEELADRILLCFVPVSGKGRVCR